MRGNFPWPWLAVVLLSIASVSARAQDQPNAFHWVDFHSEADEPVIVWVEHALAADKWSAIREIGVLYDAALVETTQRARPDALPDSDTFQLWSVNLRTHARTLLLKGVKLRWVAWMNMRDGSPRELAILYDDCQDCAATTYFTSFHYDYDQHILAPRWLRGGQAAPVWTNAAPQGVQLTQAYAVLAQPNGHESVTTWSHYDYGKAKAPEDYLYRYDVDSFNGTDRMQRVSGKDAEELKLRLCSASISVTSVARGQESALCEPYMRARPERQPVTTPPANAQGRSVPPGTHTPK